MRMLHAKKHVSAPEWFSIFVHVELGLRFASLNVRFRSHHLAFLVALVVATRFRWLLRG